MRKERGLSVIDRYKDIRGLRGYLPYLEDDVESFLAWPEGQEKLFKDVLLVRATGIRATRK